MNNIQQVEGEKENFNPSFIYSILRERNETSGQYFQ